jgi:hypothetical protein
MGTNHTSRSMAITIWLTRELEVAATNLHGGDVDFVEEENQIIYQEKVYFGKQLETSDFVNKTTKPRPEGENIKSEGKIGTMLSVESERQRYVRSVPSYMSVL